MNRPSCSSIALAAVSTYLPATSVPITAIGERFGLTSTELAVFRHFYGLDTVRLDADATPTELLARAVAGLDLSGREEQVRYVVQARTFQFVGPHAANPVHAIRSDLKLRRSTAFTVTQHGCASGLLAIELVGRLLAEDGDPDSLALVLSGEKVFTPMLEMLPGMTFMGEGTAACLVAMRGDGDRLLAYATRTLSRHHPGLLSPPQLAWEFKRDYLPTLTEVILAALADAGIGLDDLALVLPHNVNRISWVQACQRLGYPVVRVFLDNVPITGHCFCADSFLNYRDACDRGLLVAGDRYLMVNVGLGGTFSAMVFEH